MLIFASSTNKSMEQRAARVKLSGSRILRRARHTPVVVMLVMRTMLTASASLSEPLLSTAIAAEPATTSATASAEADLPPLPQPPKLEPLPAERAEVDDLDSRLRRVQSDSSDERKEAVREILEVRPKLVAAVLQRLEKLASRADRERMKRAMAQVREKTNRASDTSESNSLGTIESRPDLLMQLIERARPKDEGWRELVELVALSRMLTQVGNVQAARGLIEIYVRFGEFTRVDVQNRLFDLKDGAVAALIEARRHRAEKVARWAERQLDRLGKGVPSEAIRTDDFEVLADVLRAYGRTKDPDAARIIVTYASSERFQLREAARQAIALLGEVGIWQLRDAYESVVGKRPRRDWSWDRTARELFFEYDRLHAAKAYELLDIGNKAASAGRFEDMAKAYDSLLARAPQFDKAWTLAPGYYRLAEKVALSDPTAAQTALVRVERLATDSTLRQKARSLRDTIRADQEFHQGVVDAYLIRRAIERDPLNQRARDLLTVGDRAKVEALTLRTRWLTSGAIALTAAIAILLIWLRRGGQSDQRKSATQQTQSSQADATTGLNRPQPIPFDVVSTKPLSDSRDRSASHIEAADKGALVKGEPEPGTVALEVTAPLKPRDPFEDIF